MHVDTFNEFLFLIFEHTNVYPPLAPPIYFITMSQTIGFGISSLSRQISHFPLVFGRPLEMAFRFWLFTLLRCNDSHDSNEFQMTSPDNQGTLIQARRCIV